LAGYADACPVDSRFWRGACAAAPLSAALWAAILVAIAMM